MIYLNSIAEDSKLVFKIKIYIPFLRVPIIPFHSGYFNGAKYIQFRTGKLFWMWETISVQNMFNCSECEKQFLYKTCSPQV